MATEDKTYCGQGDPDLLDTNDPAALHAFAALLGVTEEDVTDAIEKAGNDRSSIIEFFRSRENSY